MVLVILIQLCFAKELIFKFRVSIKHYLLEKNIMQAQPWIDQCYSDPA